MQHTIRAPEIGNAVSTRTGSTSLFITRFARPNSATPPQHSQGRHPSSTALTRSVSDGRRNPRSHCSHSLRETADESHVVDRSSTPADPSHARDGGFSERTPNFTTRRSTCPSQSSWPEISDSWHTGAHAPHIRISTHLWLVSSPHLCLVSASILSSCTLDRLIQSRRASFELAFDGLGAAYS